MSTRRSHRLRIAIAVAMAMLVAGCGSSPEAGPTEPSSKVDAGPTTPSPSSIGQDRFGQAGGWIAYTSRDGIWAVDPARPERQIWLSRADGDPIAWSSDGTKLLIRRASPIHAGGAAGGRDLIVLEAEGTETRLTTADATGGSFSPDGSRVVYAAGPWARSAVYAVSSDGGAPELILRSTRRVRGFLAFAYHPALSPDGMRIAYFDGMFDHSHSLWMANADGSGRHVLLDNELSEADHMRALTWSPDGDWLAFTTDASLYVVRPDGTGLRRVVSSGFVTAPAVQWSPDGSRIAYLRMGTPCVSGPVDTMCEAELVIVNVAGGDEQVIEGIRTKENARIAWNPKV